MEGQSLQCQYGQGCSRKALFGIRGNLEPTACRVHKLEIMIRISIQQICGSQGCEARASYGFLSDGNLKRCRRHHTKGMVCIRKRCRIEGCSRLARCGTIEAPRDAKWCIHHKPLSASPPLRPKSEPDLFATGPDDDFSLGVSTNSNLPPAVAETVHSVSATKLYLRCGEKWCRLKAVFGFPQEDPKFCNVHKVSGMVQMVALVTCEECPRRASYGFVGHPVRVCLHHRKEGMVLGIFSGRCQTVGCTKKSKWGFEQGALPEFCDEHRPPNAVHEAKPNSCDFQACGARCGAQATFGFVVEKYKRRCSAHKLPGMTRNIRVLKDPCRAPGGCNRAPHWGYFGGSRERCSLHKTSGMVLIKKKLLCSEPNCKKKPVCGAERIERCWEHRKPGADVLWCQTVGCNNRACYGFEQELKRFCGLHKLRGMTQSPENLCISENCKEQARFGFPGEIAEYCWMHKFTDMVEIVHLTQCEVGSCSKRPCFGFYGAAKRRCASHKAPGMIKLTFRKICEIPGCPRRPTYGFQGEPKQFCSWHKMDGLVGISRICEQPSCTKTANYGMKGQPRRFCASHRLPEMELFARYCKKKTPEKVKDGQRPQKYCEEVTCTRVSKFGFPGGEAKLCAYHRFRGMVNRYFPKCEENGCNKVPHYGFPGGRRRFCQTHKTGKMRMISSKKKCEFPGCHIIPSYGWSLEGTRQYCTTHKFDGMQYIYSGKRKKRKTKRMYRKKMGLINSNNVFQPCFGLINT